MKLVNRHVDKVFVWFFKSLRNCFFFVEKSDNFLSEFFKNGVWSRVQPFPISNSFSGAAAFRPLDIPSTNIFLLYSGKRSKLSVKLCEVS
jgi:hypothetical protein